MKKTFRLTSIILCIISVICIVASGASATAIVPAKPTELEGEAYDASSLYLMWEEAKYADGYRIYIRKDGKWKKLADTEETDYDVENLTASTKYTFAVKSFRKNGDGTNTMSKSYAKVSVTTDKMSKPAVKAAASTTTVELKWTKVAGATGYRVYIRKSGKWVKVKTLSAKNTAYTVTGLEGLKEYRFTVRPYAKTDKGTVWGSYATSVKVTTRNPKQVQLTATSTSKAITLKWEKVAGATGYRVYVRENGKWKKLKTTKATTYTASSLKSDTYYSYAVKAYKKSKGKTTWYPLSETCKYATAPVSKNLKATRIKNLEKTYGKNHYSEVSLIDKDFGNVTMITAVKNNNVYVKTDMSLLGGTSFIFNGKTKKYYTIMDEYKAYYVTEDYSDELIDTSIVEDTSKLKIKVKVAELDGRKVVCEYFKDKEGIINRYYFTAGELVAYEVDASETLEGEGLNLGDLGLTKEDLIERYYVTKLTTKVSDKYFKVPSGYKQVTMEELVELMMKDA